MLLFRDSHLLDLQTGCSFLQHLPIRPPFCDFDYKNLKKSLHSTCIQWSELWSMKVYGGIKMPFDSCFAILWKLRNSQKASDPQWSFPEFILKTTALKDCLRYSKAAMTHFSGGKNTSASLEASQQCPQSQSRNQAHWEWSCKLWLPAQESKRPAGHKWGNSCSSRMSVCLRVTFQRERNPSHG